MNDKDIKQEEKLRRTLNENIHIRAGKVFKALLYTEANKHDVSVSDLIRYFAMKGLECKIEENVKKALVDYDDIFVKWTEELKNKTA